MTTITPTDGLLIREDTKLAPGIHFVPGGIDIAANGITLDGEGATLIGLGDKTAGVRINGLRDVTVRNLTLRDYHHDIRAEDCKGLIVRDCTFRTSGEVPANTIFLDIWLPAQESYAGGILLNRVADSRIESNDLQHQQSGLLAYDCTGLNVSKNNASYCSGFGFYLNGTSNSHFTHNFADYCCRFEPREGGPFIGHMGADAAGFVVVRNSCKNRFYRNAARLGGDGFFLAGLGSDGIPCGCNDNLFVENDGSLSPNIAFEATFCRGNIFRDNFADRCNYGFWLGFSWDTVIEGNRMVMNRQAGIAVENGHHFEVKRNNFQANGHGILIWTKQAPDLTKNYPDSLASYQWQIEDNTFTRNGKGIRIAADQDHGIRSMPLEACGSPEARPREHVVRKNDIQDNRIGIELHGADSTTIEQNILNLNVEANLRQDDCAGTVVRNNLGSAGGYL